MKVDYERALANTLDYDAILRAPTDVSTRGDLIRWIGGILDDHLSPASLDGIAGSQVGIPDLLDGFRKLASTMLGRKRSEYPFDPSNSGLPSIMGLAHADLDPQVYHSVALLNPDAFALNIANLARQEGGESVLQAAQIQTAEDAEDPELWVNPWRIGQIIAWMRGFQRTGRTSRASERLPIAEVLAPRELQFTVGSTHEVEAGASFDIKASGFSLGYGTKKTVSYAGKDSGVTGGFQLQTTAFYSVEEYENSAGERIHILNLDRIAPSASVVSPPSSSLVELAYVGEFEPIDAFETVADAGACERSTSIVREHSATFSVARSNEDGTKTATFGINSKSTTGLATTVAYPLRKRYVVRGLNASSVIRSFEQEAKSAA